MPVVIQELVVRVVVEPDATSAITPRREDSALSADERTALVEAAVRETLTILRREKER
jgi:hypothetical protein